MNCYTPSGGSHTCVGPAVILENEDLVLDPSAFVSSQAGFVSSATPHWGRQGPPRQRTSRTTQSSSSRREVRPDLQGPADCGGLPLNGATNAIGEVNGVTATEATILKGTFPVDRYVYNVYSNGSNSNIPAANAATVNYVSAKSASFATRTRGSCRRHWTRRMAWST